MLLVLLAIALPFIVQIRTVAGFVGIEVSWLQTAAIGLVVVIAIVLWAVWPARWLPSSAGNARGG